MSDNETLVIVIDWQDRGREKLRELNNRKPEEPVEKSQSRLVYEDGTIILLKSRNIRRVRGYHADILIVNRDVRQETYEQVVVPAAAHGVLIDNR